MLPKEPTFGGRREYHLENVDENYAYAPAAVPRVRRELLLGVCYAVNLLYGAYLGAIGVLLPRIGADFHIDPSDQGKLMSAGFAGSVVSVLVCGYLADRLGRKAVLVGAGVLFSTGLLLYSVAPALTFALLAAPLIGAGTAGMQAAASALAADLCPERRGHALNACQVAFAVGAVIGPGVIYLILIAGVKWRSIYFGLGILALLLTAVILAQPIVRGDRDSSSHSAAGLVNALWKPAFVLLCLAQLFYAGAEVGFFEWMPTYFDKSLAGGKAFEGSVVSLFWVGMMLGRLGMGVLLGRFETLVVGFCLCTVGGICGFSALTSRQPLVVLAFVLLTGLFFGGIYSSIIVEAGDRYHSRALLGTVLGGISAASSVGTSLVPWAVGASAAYTGSWRIGLSLPALSALAAGFVLVCVRLQSKTADREVVGHDLTV